MASAVPTRPLLPGLLLRKQRRTGEGLPEAGPRAVPPGQCRLRGARGGLSPSLSSASLLLSPGSRRGASTQAPAPGFREGQGSPFTFSKMPGRNYSNSASNHQALRYCASPRVGKQASGLARQNGEGRRLRERGLEHGAAGRAGRCRGVSAGNLSCLTQAARVAGSSSPQVSSTTVTCLLWGFRVDSSPFRHWGKAQVAEAATPLGEGTHLPRGPST